MKQTKMNKTKKLFNYTNRRQEPMWSIEKIIEEENIVIYFQPIVSSYQERVTGLEALVRGIDDTGNIISPIALFEAANEAGIVISLDRLCQRKAIEAFREIIVSYPDMMLFLNIDISVVHLHTDEEAIYEYAVDNNIPSKQIILEINELQTDDPQGMSVILDFANKYREKGFAIAVDDIGAGFSNLDRVALLKPDIIKIDRGLIEEIDKHYYKQQTVDMLIKLGEKIGALIVAEGAETFEEIGMVMKFGAHFIQGFYISKPQKYYTEFIDSLDGKIREVISGHGENLNNHLVEKCNMNSQLRKQFSDIKCAIEAYDDERIEAFMSATLRGFKSIECAYIINKYGMQISDTVFNGNPIIRNRALFSPYKKGDNAKLKAYYYVLQTTKQDMYISDEYLSLATGSRCVTISGYFQHKMGTATKQCILCLDVLL